MWYAPILIVVSLILLVGLYVCVGSEFKHGGLCHEEKLIVAQNVVRNNGADVVRRNGNHVYGLPVLVGRPKLDLSSFKNVMGVGDGWVEVEGNITVADVLRFLHARNLNILVIPDLSHLTIGGLIAGIGGGSATFRHGFFHEQVLECEVLLRNGDVVQCTPDNEHAALFAALPNTLGTLGYVTKLKLRTVHLQGDFVSTHNRVFKSPHEYFSALESAQQDRTIDFLDGVIFGHNNFVLVQGKYTTTRPQHIHNFVNDRVYWQAIQVDEFHYFKLMDYIYRWDTDLYFSSCNIPGVLGDVIRSPSFRKLIPKRSVGLVKSCIGKACANKVLDIVQDVLIPFENMVQFYQWYDKHIDLYPIYICPASASGNTTFWQQGLRCDFGIGYGVETDRAVEKTKAIEAKMVELGGLKFLYTKSYMDEDVFWRLFDPDGVYSTIRQIYGAGTSASVFDKIKG